MVATRLGLAVFSDDRFVRVRARQMGRPAFGSLALIDAMEAKGYIDSEQRTVLRRRLRTSGAWGTNPTIAELIDEASANNWTLTRSLEVAFNDPGPILADTPGTVRSYQAFLRACHASGSPFFGDWVARVLDRLCRAAPRVPLHGHARNLVLLAFDITDGSHEAYLHALIDAINERGPALGHIGDAAFAAVEVFSEMIAEGPHSGGLKVLLIRAVIDQLPLPTRAQARLLIFGRLVSVKDPWL